MYPEREILDTHTKYKNNADIYNNNNNNNYNINSYSYNSRQ